MKIRDISQETMKLIERNVEMVSKHDTTPFLEQLYSMKPAIVLLE